MDFGDVKAKNAISFRSADKYQEILTFPNAKTSARKSFRKPIFLDIKASFVITSGSIQLTIQPLPRSLPHERRPQILYTQLLTGVSLPCWELKSSSIQSQTHREMRTESHGS